MKTIFIFLKSKFIDKKSFFLGILLAILVAVSDLISKKVIFSILENIALTSEIGKPEIEIFSFFNLVLVWNRGVSFGMFSHLDHSQIIFSIIQFLILLILFFWLYRNKNPYFTFALGLIIGGALGNLIDRIKNGAVADFLDFHIASYHWPAFNLADSAVFVGVMILVCMDIFYPSQNFRKNV